MFCACQGRCAVKDYHILEEGAEGGYGDALGDSDCEEGVGGVRRGMGWRRRWPDMVLGVYLLVYWGFLFMGAAFFSQIEGPLQEAMKERLTESRAAFLKRHPCVSDSGLEDLIVEIITANNRGVSAAKNTEGEHNWSFGQSFFFSSTIVTTIGYGHVHPLSEGGKIFCIIYAIIGIPMTFILLTALVERLLLPTTWLLYWLNSKLGHLYQPFNIRVFHLSVIGMLTFSLFMVVPAFIFAKLEPGWDFLDSLYYCFISLTTIGLGDYIPGDAAQQPMRPLYKICITAYLLFGLTFVMLLLHLYNDIPQLNLGLFLLRGSDLAAGDPERMRLSGTGGVAPNLDNRCLSGAGYQVGLVTLVVGLPRPPVVTRCPCPVCRVSSSLTKANI
ncbi:Potassium channel subfamily K member 1 [Chionoecetes opilio]|uniref:Potassium channel subfamily K member 1 n=1 Tax=Chionoecetes opilio TaxID=41210 RepID=A0A8J5CMJ5_CHIOP|nr:Potassium channel subfamily K member 1 [Chionoecetes opilio]